MVSPIKTSVQIEKRVHVCAGGYAPKVARVGLGHYIVASRTALRGIGNNSSVSLVESRDGGYTWSLPAVLCDSPNDDRIQSLSLLPDGTLLLGFAQVNEQTESYLMRSSDHGKTWTEPERLDPSPFDYVYPFGHVIADSSGELLMPAYCGYYPMYDNTGKPPERQSFSSVFYASPDGGRSWFYSRLIARFTGQPSVIRLSSGKMLASLRSAKTFTDTGYQALMKSATEYVKVPDEVLISESSDGGKAWSTPRSVTGPGELHGFLVQSASGDVLMTCGIRHEPYGVALKISEDEGRTWGEFIPLVIDAPSPDVGLTQTLEREPGRFVTFYYSEGGLEIAYPLRDEPWGQRRFAVYDPSGTWIDVVQQIDPAPGFWDKYLS